MDYSAHCWFYFVLLTDLAYQKMVQARMLKQCHNVVKRRHSNLMLRYVKLLPAPN